MSKICSRCGSTIPDISSFCPVCGNAVRSDAQSAGNLCENCGSPLDPGSGFCLECGAKVDPVQQHPQPAPLPVQQQRPQPAPPPVQQQYSQPAPPPVQQQRPQPAPPPVQQQQYPQPAPPPVQQQYPQPPPPPVQQYPQSAPPPVQQRPQPTPPPVQQQYPQPATTFVQQQYPQPAPPPVQQQYPQPAPQPVQQQYPQPTPPPVQQQYPQTTLLPVQQPMYAPQGQMMSQQIAQQAYINAQQQNAPAVNMKPQRFIPLRVILIIICLVLAFFVWKDGIRNIKNAMLEPTAFSMPVTEDEDIEALQARYDEAYANPQPAPKPVFKHDFLSWLYIDDVSQDGTQGGAQQ